MVKRALDRHLMHVRSTAAIPIAVLAGTIDFISEKVL